MKEKRTLFEIENSFGIRNRKASPMPEQQAERTKSCQSSVSTETSTTDSILHNCGSTKQNKNDFGSTLNGAKKNHLHTSPTAARKREKLLTDPGQSRQSKHRRIEQNFNRRGKEEGTGIGFELSFHSDVCNARCQARRTSRPQTGIRRMIEDRLRKPNPDPLFVSFASFCSNSLCSLCDLLWKFSWCFPV